MVVRYAVRADDIGKFGIGCAVVPGAISSAMYGANAGCAAILRQVRMPKISACMS